MKFHDFPNIDGHVHAEKPSDGAFFREYREKQGFDAYNLACISCREPMDAGDNLLGALLKLEDPSCYAHASLVYPTFPALSTEENAREFLRQAEEMEEVGFDGVKLIETKPSFRKRIVLPLSDPAFEPFFSHLEKNGTHLVWHACDPETFWDKDQAPDFAFENGWFYGDGTYPTKEALYKEVYDVMDKHPRLNAAFAHFLFLSDFLKQAEEFLRKYPRACLDITPGREMYDNFTKHADETRALFHAYADRIVFGTDMTSDEFQGDQDELVSAVRRFLSTGERFPCWGFDIQGVKLPEDKLSKVCGGNFIRDVSKAPREINRGALKRMIARWLPSLPASERRAFIEEQYKAL